MSQVYSQKFDRFKSEVKQALEDEDDALAAYTRFVEWLVEYEQEHGQLPSSNGPNDSDLLLVLEEAVRKLKDDNLCLSDRRYMKLWTMFAKRVDAPEQIYAYMLSNKIGTMFSPLYEEYAKVLERNDKCVISLKLLSWCTDPYKTERSKRCLSTRDQQSRARCR